MKKYLTNIGLIITVILMMFFSIYSSYKMINQDIDESGIAGIFVAVLLIIVLAMIILISLTLILEVIYLILDGIMKAKQLIDAPKGFKIVFYLCTIGMLLVSLFLALTTVINLFNNKGNYTGLDLINSLLMLGYFILIASFFAVRINYLRNRSSNSISKMFKISLVVSVVSFLIFIFRSLTLKADSFIDYINISGLLFLFTIYFVLSIFHYKIELKTKNLIE